MKKQKLNQKGAIDIVTTALLLVVIALLAFVAWRVTTTEDTTVNTNNEAVPVVESSPVEEPEASATPEPSLVIDSNIARDEKEENSDANEIRIIDNEHFSITLPQDWQESDADAPAGAPEMHYSFRNDVGKELIVALNSGGFGAGGDGSVDFTVVSDIISIGETYEVCTPMPDAAVGDNCGIHREDKSLLLVAINRDGFDAKISGNSYLLWFKDSDSHSQESYADIADIANTIKFNTN